MTEERNYEEEAKVQGWKSDGELDAQAFVEKGEKIAGIQKNKADRLAARVESLEASNREFGEYQRNLLAKEKQKSADLLVQLKNERAQAITDGDGQAYNKANEDISNVERGMVDTPQQNNGLDAMATQWLSENQWYNTNQNLRIYADGLADVVSNEGYRGPAYYTELTRRVQEAFPQAFENPNKAKQTSVESGGQKDTEASKNAHVYENLPTDAKAACDRFVANGLMSKKDFTAAYEWD